MRFRIALLALLLTALASLPEGLPPGLRLAVPATAQVLQHAEQAMAEYVEAHAEEQVAFLEHVVNINSGTLNVQGVRAVGDVFRAELEAIGFDAEWVALPDSLQRAGHLFARRRGDGGGRRLLLIGHLDTVFEPDHPFQRFEREGDRARGPGVSDMKGGDVVMLYALKALDAAGVLDRMTVTVALIGDEEKPGFVPVSRGPLIDAARESDVALAFETATGLGWATVARRGIATWRLEVAGRESHSSGVFDEYSGAGAVFEASRILNAFYSYLRGETYLTFNPGVILGGTRVNYDGGTSRGTAFGKMNVIADTVVVEGDLRFLTQEQRDRAQSAMRTIVGSGNLPHTHARIAFDDLYPAMPPTEGNLEVLGVLDAVSRELGHGPVEAWDPGRRGAADISFVTHLVSGLDGLGAMGEGDHGPEESIDLPSLPTLTQRAALLMYRLGVGY